MGDITLRYPAYTRIVVDSITHPLTHSLLASPELAVRREWVRYFRTTGEWKKREGKKGSLSEHVNKPSSYVGDPTIALAVQSQPQRRDDLSTFHTRVNGMYVIRASPIFPRSSFIVLYIVCPSIVYACVPVPHTHLKRNPRYHE